MIKHLLSNLCRALARIGNSHFKLGDLKNAKTYLEKSLAEHRSDDTLKKVKEVCKSFYSTVYVIRYSDISLPFRSR